MLLINICMHIYIHTYTISRIDSQYPLSLLIVFHLRKGLYSKRSEFNKFILRAVSHIVLLRCRLIYNQHYAPYEHIYIYIYTIHSYAHKLFILLAMSYTQVDTMILCIYIYMHIYMSKNIIVGKQGHGVCVKDASS